jgi:hypothetical protein
VLRNLIINQKPFAMKPGIQVQFSRIPRKIFSDFEQNIDKSIELEIYEDLALHFEAPADVIIYINEHLTDIIVGGVGVGLLTNGLWDGLKALFEKVIKRKKHTRIELSFRFKSDKTLEFYLAGDVGANQVDTIVEKILKYLVDLEQQKKDFANPDFKDNRDVKPRIRVRYNPKTEKLEIVNFAELKKNEEGLLKRLFQRLNS